MNKYLKDSAKEEAGLVANLIEGGGTMSETEQVRIGAICVTLERISEIEFDEIEDFYKPEEE